MHSGAGIGEKNNISVTCMNILKCVFLRVIAFFCRRYFTVQNNQLMYQKRLKVVKKHSPYLPSKF